MQSQTKKRAVGYRALCLQDPYLRGHCSCGWSRTRASRTVGLRKGGVAVITSEAVQPIGGARAQQSLIGWLHFPPNLMLILRQEWGTMSAWEWRQRFTKGWITPTVVWGPQGQKAIFSKSLPDIRKSIISHSLSSQYKKWLMHWDFFFKDNLGSTAPLVAGYTSYKLYCFKM